MYLIDHYVPVLARVTEILDDEEKANAYDYDSLRQELVDLIERASASCRDTADESLCRDATFALVAFVDEKVLSSAWSQRHQWASQLLQKQYFNTTNAGVQFFEYLDELNPFSPRERDVREVFFYCLCLGFMGRYYRSGDRGALNRIIRECGDELRGPDEQQVLFPGAYPMEIPEDYTPPQRAANLQPLYIGLPLVTLLGLYLIFRNEIVTFAHEFLMMV
jgi:type VI secretion system protein ImpK